LPVYVLFYSFRHCVVSVRHINYNFIAVSGLLGEENWEFSKLALFSFFDFWLIILISILCTTDMKYPYLQNTAILIPEGALSEN